MVPGIAIPTLIQQVLEDARDKRDMVMPSHMLKMSDSGHLQIKGFSMPGNERTDTFKMTEHAQSQMFTYLGIPAKYVEQLRKESPELLAHNVNSLLVNDVRKEDRRMVRMLPRLGVRGFMSDAYRRLDHEDVAENLLPIIQENGFEVRSAQITDSRLYIQAVSPRLEGEIKVGHPVRLGWTISNSEVGLGGLNVDPFVEVLRCTNGMILTEYGKRTAHRGGRQEFGVDYSILTSETRAANDKALWLTLRDHVRSITTPEGMHKIMDAMRKRADHEVSGDPQGVVEVLSNKFNLREDEKSSILYSFLEEKDRSRWGLVNAVTQVANSMHDYDRAVELERVGGRLLFADAATWRQVSEAAPIAV